jgi:hypothetical protein
VIVPARIPAFADEPDAPAETRRKATAEEEPPVIRLKPLEGEAAPMRAAQTFFRRLGDTASRWAAGLKGRVDGVARRLHPSLSPPSSEPPPPSALFPAPHVPLQAPPPIEELPVLRLAETVDEPREVEDYYEGPREPVFPTLWRWTKRLVLLGALAAGGVYAALNWDTWGPGATRVGGAALTEMDQYVRTQEQAAREERALQEAAAELPHLTRETIRPILAGSLTGVLDPAEVFQRACDAADRGLGALTPEEAQELRALRTSVQEAVSPAEGFLLREYDKTRGRRATFAFENRTAAELFARGARALPPESLERLRLLSAKAVADGFPRPPLPFATPEPTPEPALEASPEATPEAGLEATPGDASAAPAGAPEALPTPTPEAVPEAAPQPTPGATPGAMPDR